jgi:hypothetical protein
VIRKNRILVSPSLEEEKEEETPEIGGYYLSTSHPSTHDLHDFPGWL